MLKKTSFFIGLVLLIVIPALAQTTDIEEGNAFWYESNDPSMFISHATHPFGTKLIVINKVNNRRAIMQVGGRIPGDPDWIIAVTTQAAKALGVEPWDDLFVRLEKQPAPPVAQEAKPRTLRANIRNFFQSGNGTARFDGSDIIAGHPSLAIGTRILVTNKDNGRQAEVTIGGRVPASQERIIEFSKAAANALGITKAAHVTIESIKN
jgi:rare lipoprotein A (peptidoglycan hydrolase)